MLEQTVNLNLFKTVGSIQLELMHVLLDQYRLSALAFYYFLCLLWHFNSYMNRSETKTKELLTS